MSYTWIGWYHLAVWISVALLIASFLPYMLTGLSIVALAVYGLAAVMTGLWIIDYWKYAEAEWGDFQPRSVILSTVWPFLYALAYMSLTAASLFGAGSLQLAIVAAALVALALMAYLALNELPPITSGDVIGDLKAGTRTLPLALLAGLPLVWIFIALYEGFRMVVRGARIAGAITIISALMAPFALLFMNVIPNDALKMKYGLVEVLAWPGIIGWEELTSRFMLPLIGFAGNYMFVVLHAPSRTAALLFLAPAILAVISMATRWITDVFRERRSVVATITAHAVYNGMLSWLYGLFLFPLFMLLTLAVLGYAYITRPRERI